MFDRHDPRDGNTRDGDDGICDREADWLQLGRDPASAAVQDGADEDDGRRRGECGCPLPKRFGAVSPSPVHLSGAGHATDPIAGVNAVRSAGRLSPAQPRRRGATHEFDRSRQAARRS